jgi:hypothetical protein
VLARFAQLLLHAPHIRDLLIAPLPGGHFHSLFESFPPRNNMCKTIRMRLANERRTALGGGKP